MKCRELLWGTLRLGEGTLRLGESLKCRELHWGTLRLGESLTCRELFWGALCLGESLKCRELRWGCVSLRLGEKSLLSDNLKLCVMSGDSEVTDAQRYLAHTHPSLCLSTVLVDKHRTTLPPNWSTWQVNEC